MEYCRPALRGASAGIPDRYDDPLVSHDYNHHGHSSIFAANEITVVGDNLVRVMTWHDNEWGFSCRMWDTAVAMAKAG